MKVLITGGAGFVGANLAFYLKARDHQVVVMDNLVRRGAEYNLEQFRTLDIPFIHGDIRQVEDFLQLDTDYDVILETAAQPSAIDGYRNPVFDLTNNTFGLLHVLEFARRSGAAVIFWSTNKVYCGSKVNAIPRHEEETRFVWDDCPGIGEDFPIDGPDHSIYGLSKVCADLICQEWHDAFGLRTVINRCSCLAGPWQWGKVAQGWVAWWAIAAHFDLPLTYFGWQGKQVRDVLFASDLCRLVEMEMNNLDRIKGEVFNIGGGPEHTLSLVEATQLMERKFEKRLRNSYIPEPRKADHVIYISDISKAEKVLGWKPRVGIEDGYEEIIKWVRDNEGMLRTLYL
ncbi:MAG: NAD-dependent epimerase/dehydratase family protein [Chloroflexi bacterium]|nr:NAD-dependent epimerase/dehydratase family protein [Chloroflexota bacterium]